MKNTIKVLMLVVAFTFSSVLAASTEPAPTTSESTSAISTEIGKLLKNPKFLVEGDMVAKVKVVVNEDNELVVLSVTSDSDEFEGFIKGRLNYHELSFKLSTGQKTFVVPVRLTKEK
jgi:hypothetical protein